MTDQGFKVLVSNDDGIEAPGIIALVRELNKHFDVRVSAPEKEQSAKSHSVTVR
jgi:5'-nucleotidase